MADRRFEQPLRLLGIAAPEGNLSQMEPRLGKVLSLLESAAESRFGAIEVPPPERGQAEEVMGAAEPRIEGDGSPEPLLRRPVVAGAPLEVAELQLGFRVVGRETSVAFEGGPRRREPLLADQCGAEVGEDRRIVPIAQPERPFEFRLRFGPALDAQQQAPEEPPHPGLSRGERGGGGSPLYRLAEATGPIEDRRGQIGRLVAPRGRPAGGGQLDERLFGLALLAESLSQRESGVDKVRRRGKRRAEMRDRPGRVSGDEPERARLVERRRIARPGGEKGSNRGGGALRFARLDLPGRLHERRVGLEALRPASEWEQERHGAGRCADPLAAGPHQTESALPMLPTGHLFSNGRRRRAPHHEPVAKVPPAGRRGGAPPGRTVGTGIPSRPERVERIAIAIRAVAAGVLTLLAGGCGQRTPEGTPPTDSGSEVLPVGGDIRRPARVRFEPPRYPEAARERGEEALVVLELTLDREGAVAEARSLRGPEDMGAAAVAAAREWAYEPTLVGGERVPIRFAETVRFVLRPAGGQGMRLPARAPAGGRPPEASRFPDWEISGHAFTACPCDTPCPCRSNGPPSHPPCHATTATRLDSGRYGDVDLAGSAFVTLGPESWVALYLDEAMSEPARRAILGIFRSLAPGAPQRYRAIRRVPLAITESGRPDGEITRRAFIPGILEMETVLSREGGRLAGLLPGMDVWSNEIAYGRTGVYRFHDPTIPAGWDHSGRQSNAKEFTLNRGMYREGRMLIQHADGSGDWTAPQRALFSCARRGAR